MQPAVVIRFITEADWISAAIRIETRGSVSHVEFVLPDGSFLGARADGGIQIRNASQYGKLTTELRYAVPIPKDVVERVGKTADDIVSAIYARAKSKIGTVYNFEGIAGLMLEKKALTNPHALFCSQFVTETFADEGFPLLNVLDEYANYITPRDVHISPYLVGHLIDPKDYATSAA